jgi:tetratricopeptide (TPR) repeat protein
MSRPTPHLFVSATSVGLREYREETGKVLIHKKILPVSQEYFETDYRAIREMLKKTISKCDGVICLIGPYYGFEPVDRPDGEHRRSYTQLEFFMARELGKPVYRFLAGECPEFAAVALEPADKEQLQQDFISQVTQTDTIHYSFRDKAELRDLILRIAVPHHDPQRQPRNLPYPSLGPLFKGRDPFLDDLRHTLQQPAHCPIAIHGLGGVGKTRLAVEYALRHAGDYTALLFVTADSPESLHRNLAALCGPLVLNLAEWEVADETVRETAVRRWLQEQPGWLLILDNVDTTEAAGAVEELLDELHRGAVLITTRLSDWSCGVTTREVDVLSPEAAAEFLLERTAPRRRLTPDDPAEVRGLAHNLDCLALALEQAGAFISQKRCSLADYRDRWRQHDRAVHDWYDERLMKYPRSVATTWDTTMEQLGEDATALLRILSWLAPEPLPRTLLPTLDLQDALAELAGYSLVRLSDDGDFFRVLRLVQEVTRERMSAEDKNDTLRMVLDLLHNAAPAEPDDVRTWPVWDLLRPHVAVATDHADGCGIAEPTSGLMNDLAVLLNSKALHVEAEPIMCRVLAIDEASYGADHPEVATDLNNLAQLFKATNRLGEAEPLMRRALAIDEASYGADHPEVATDLNNLAQMLQATNRLGEAEPLMRRALAIDEASYGVDHLKVAIRLNNLAHLLKATNRLGEAEPLMRRALAIDKASYGADHPNVARDLNNLAQLFKATNRLGEAEPLMRRALAIDEASYGTDHPNVARDLNNLAQLLQDTNRLAEAEPLMRRALAILVSFTQETGYQHPHLGAVYENYRELQRLGGLGEEEIELRLKKVVGVRSDVAEAEEGPDHTE